MDQEDRREETSFPRVNKGSDEERRGDDAPVSELAELTLQLEKAVDIREELEALVRAEYDEMESGWRPWGPDWESIIAAQSVGTFHILTARRGNQLIGYLSWILDFDMESYGTLIAHQCAWYVKPNNFRVAARMFDWATTELRRIRVKFFYLHNSERGRGKTLGKFFERKGAVHSSNTYTMKL